MKGEAESMTNRVKTEQSERAQAIQQLAHEMGETIKGVELKISNLDSQAARDIRDLRGQLLEQSKALSEEMKAKHDQMKGQLEHEAGANPRRHDRTRSARRNADAKWPCV